MKGKNLVFALKGLYSLGYNSVSPILPVFLRSITGSATEIAMVPSAFQLSRTLGALFFGHASDRIGHRRSLMLALGLAMAAAVSLLFAKTIAEFALVFFVAGIASGVYYISLDAIATTLHEKKGAVLSGLEAAFHAGFLAGPIIGGFLAKEYGMEYAFAFWAVVALCALFAASRLKYRNEKIRTGRESAWSEICEAASKIGNGGSFSFALATFSDGLAETAFWLAFPLFALSLGFDIFEIGAMSGIAAGITALLITRLGDVSDARGRQFSLLLSFALMLSAAVAMVFLHSFVALCLLAGIFALGRSAGYMNTRAIAADMASVGNRASILSVQELFFTGGRAVGPMFAGVIIDSSGAAAAFGAIAAVLAVAMGAMAILRGTTHGK